MFQLPHHLLTTKHTSNPREHGKQKFWHKNATKVDRFYVQKYTLLVVKTTTITNIGNLIDINITNITKQNNVYMIIATTEAISKHKHTLHCPILGPLIFPMGEKFLHLDIENTPSILSLLSIKSCSFTTHLHGFHPWYPPLKSRSP